MNIMNSMTTTTRPPKSKPTTLRGARRGTVFSYALVAAKQFEQNRELTLGIVTDYWIEPFAAIHSFSRAWISFTNATSSGCGNISLQCSAWAASLSNSP